MATGLGAGVWSCFDLATHAGDATAPIAPGVRLRNEFYTGARRYVAEERRGDVHLLPVNLREECVLPPKGASTDGATLPLHTRLRHADTRKQTKTTTLMDSTMWSDWKHDAAACAHCSAPLD